jgi:hypothetical protein
MAGACGKVTENQERGGWSGGEREAAEAMSLALPGVE